jgi:hypothetical protein
MPRREPEQAVCVLLRKDESKRTGLQYGINTISAEKKPCVRERGPWPDKLSSVSWVWRRVSRHTAINTVPYGGSACISIVGAAFSLGWLTATNACQATTAITTK